MKYNQPQGPDTMEKKGVTKNITTKLQCITAMKEYEGNDLKGVLFANEPVCGAQATFTTGFGGFSNSNSCSNSGSDLHAKPFSAANTGFSFELGGRFGGFNAANTGLGVATSLGGTLNQTGANEAAQVQQTLIALSDSPYDDSPLFWYLKDSKTKREEVLKPTNPDTQKALLANQHQVSPRPMAKIRPKALSGALNGSKCLQNMESLIWLLVLLAVLLQCTFTRGITHQQYLELRRGKIDLQWKCMFCVVPDSLQESEHEQESNHNSTARSGEVPPYMEVDVSPMRATFRNDEIPDVTFDVTGREFNRPMEPLDESLPDQPLDDVIPDDEPVKYKIVEAGTNRGAPKLVSTDGYTYTRGVKSGGRQYWRCAVRNKSVKCPASIKEFNGEFTPGIGGHVHPADPGAAKKVKISKR